LPGGEIQPVQFLKIQAAGGLSHRERTDHEVALRQHKIDPRIDGILLRIEDFAQRPLAEQPFALYSRNRNRCRPRLRLRRCNALPRALVLIPALFGQRANLVADRVRF
jgi:hypothetical protein